VARRQAWSRAATLVLIYGFKRQQPDREPCRDPGPALLAIARRDLTVGKVPVDLAGELSQFVLKPPLRLKQTLALAPYCNEGAKRNMIA
jgi:hypothetical protein